MPKKIWLRQCLEDHQLTLRLPSPSCCRQWYMRQSLRFCLLCPRRFVTRCSHTRWHKRYRPSLRDPHDWRFRGPGVVRPRWDLRLDAGQSRRRLAVRPPPHLRIPRTQQLVPFSSIPSTSLARLPEMVQVLKFGDHLVSPQLLLPLRQQSYNYEDWGERRGWVWDLHCRLTQFIKCTLSRINALFSMIIMAYLYFRQLLN